MSLSNTFSVTIQAAGQPAWMAPMTDKTWLGIAGSVGQRIYDVRPLDYNGPTGTVAGVCNDWTGAVVNSDTWSFVFPAQGGHNGYQGNEVYRLTLTAAAPAWVRDTECSKAGFGAGSYEYSNPYGPAPPHSEGMITYAPNVQRIFLTAQPYADVQGNSSKNFWSYNPSAKTWTKIGNPPVSWATSGAVHGGSDYDQTTGYVWTVGTQCPTHATCRYDPVGGTWQSWDHFVNQGYRTMVCIAASKRALVCVRGTHSGGAVVVLNLDAPASGWTTVTQSGSGPSSGTDMGVCWHEPSGAFLVWEGGTTVYKLTPSASVFGGTWTWTPINAAGGSANPGNMNPQGTTGKFRIVRNVNNSGRDVLITLNDVLAPTYVYKLPASGL